VFTARYAKSPYITQIRFVFKELIRDFTQEIPWSAFNPQAIKIAQYGFAQSALLKNLVLALDEILSKRQFELRLVGLI